MGLSAGGVRPMVFLMRPCAGATLSPCRAVPLSKWCAGPLGNRGKVVGVTPGVGRYLGVGVGRSFRHPLVPGARWGA